MSKERPRIYSIKQHGTTLEDCDSEPVHTPGCVQAHGALLVVRPRDLVVLQVSENSQAILGLAPDAILGKNVIESLGEDAARQIRRFLNHERIERNPLYALTFEPLAASGRLDMIIHTIHGQVLVEVEPSSPAGDADTDHHAEIGRMTARIEAAPTMLDMCQVIAEEVRRITGLDRVMVYRFNPDDTGEVVAEDRRADMPSWLGLRYPSHDIPKPAREMFKKIWIRPLPDAAGQLAEMVPLANPDTGKPLEMTYCGLRGASVMYTDYLRNMGAAASLTLAIHREGALWGLVTGQHETPARFPYQQRAACELLAHFISLHLKQAEEREHLKYRARIEANHYTLLARAAREGGLATMAAPSPSLLDGIDAGGAAIYHRDRWWTVGITPSEAQLDELARWLRVDSPLLTEGQAVFATDWLSADFPAAAAYAGVASGLLATAVSRGHRDLILWFRPEVKQTVTWGGDPHALPTIDGPLGPRLVPRESFESWQEIMFARGVPWKTIEIEAAHKLKLLVMDLAVTRAEHFADLNQGLARRNQQLGALARDPEHVIKERLRGTSKYGQLLLEDAREGNAFDHRTDERVETLVRMTSRMDGLLDGLLHFAPERARAAEKVE